MKITIDTKEDSAEDIRKVMSLLSTLVGESNYNSSSSPSSESSSSNIFEDNSPAVGNAFGAMFGNDSNPEPSAAASEPNVVEDAPVSSPMNIFSSPAPEPETQDSDGLTEEEKKAADLIMEY